MGPGALAPSLARGEGYLGFTRNGWQETIGVHMTSGAPEQLIVLPRATYLPLFIALTTAGVVLGFLFKLYLLSLALTLVVAGLFRSRRASAGSRATTARCRSSRAESAADTEVPAHLPGVGGILRCHRRTLCVAGVRTLLWIAALMAAPARPEPTC